MTWVNVYPFEVGGSNPVTISATATTAGVAVLYNPPDPYLGDTSERRNLSVRLVNKSSIDVKFRLMPTATGVATATTGLTILARTTEVFSAARGPYISVLATGAATVEATPGEGT